ncbi:MAG TPA: rhodanese-like domain-containing protein [Rhodocyclaceae bacterium]|nr:rhodanese-like domain-containing protein [Rhodocyclaceae bacterium]
MDFLLQNVFWVAGAVLGLAGWVWTLMDQGGGVGAQEAVQLLNKEHGIVLDVRDAIAFGSGHLPNARNIPLADLERRVGELEKSKNRPIIICGEGGQASKASALLQKSGYDKATVLNGGVTAWKDAGMPVEK